MAKLKDILDAESKRSTVDECRVVRLYAEGTFYRAYEWSAWLCVRYIQDFKPTKRKFKNEDSAVVFVGFPVASLTKYSPDGAEMSVAEDKSVSLLLPAGVLGDTADVAALTTDFANWKQSVALAESSKKDAPTDGIDGGGRRPGRLTDIMHSILAYPIEQKSPLESMQFLADVKKRIADIL